jgi:hypothetical protein
LRTLFGRGSAKNGGGAASRSLTAAAANLSRRRFIGLAENAGLLSPDHFCGIGWTGTVESGRLLRMIDRLGEGTTELMCHPGFYDDALDRKATRLKSERQAELDALTAPEVARKIRERGVQLISFRELVNSDA